jgi:hypothetical protein
MLLQGTRHFSDGHVGTSTGLKALPRRPRYHLYRAQGTSLPATLAPSYTPLYNWTSPCVYKRGCPGPHGEKRGKTGGQGGEREGQTCNVRTHERTTQTSGGRQSRRDAVEAAPDGPPQGRTLSFSLSLASHSLSLSLSRNACNPYCKHPQVQDNISLIPSLVFHLASTHLDRGTRH